MESGEAADRPAPQGAASDEGPAEARTQPQPAPAPQAASQKPSPETLREMASLKSALADMRATVASLAETVKSLERTVSELRSEASAAKSDMARLNERASGIEEVKAEQAKARKHAKDMEKANDRIDLIMEEVGYGEEIDVAKIPPNILEVVFQSTLDDVVNQIWRDLGAHDAESVIQATLEEVRMRTSGSELFAFEGKRILTRNLGRTLEKELISARQIQTTYKELLGRLLDHLPGYKPKNFRSMIKIKSQEYAVDKATSLSEKSAELDSRLAAAESKLDTVAKRMEGLDADIAARFEEGTQRQKQEQARTFERQRAFLEDTLTQYRKGLEEQVEDLRREIEGGRSEDDRELERLRMTLASKEGAPESVPDGVSPEGATSKPQAEAALPAEPEFTEAESAILDGIGARGAKLDALLKKAGKRGIDAEGAEHAITSLKEKGLITVKGRGKARKVAKAKAPKPVTSGADDGPAAEPEAKAEEPAEKAEVPAPKKASPKVRAESLTGELKLVYDAIPRKGTTQKALAQELAEKVKYMDVLKALRTLMDEGLVEVESRGRHAVFMRTESGTKK